MEQVPSLIYNIISELNDIKSSNTNPYHWTRQPLNQHLEKLGATKKKLPKSFHKIIGETFRNILRTFVFN